MFVTRYKVFGNNTNKSKYAIVCDDTWLINFWKFPGFIVT
jgi:hypothetical protein